ncbi:response regulator [Flavobacterium poyangense]|uniref:response regulator n=1 Tax=Flavobacterium poyangense TaxID=2204302 RepID=UPI001423496D|nr:response regulator transcription factor [Flavobacterium sp. JXAS1]
MSKYNFIVADDHVVVRNGLAAFIKGFYPSSTINKVSTFGEILKLVSFEKVNLLILDVNFSNKTSLSVIPIIKGLQPSINILIYSAFDENIFAVRYISAGASGYLNKMGSETELKQAIDAVLISGRYMSNSIQNKILNAVILKKPSNPFEQLSNREIEIAKLYVEGFGNNSISDVLSLKKSTVSTYKNRIFEKLDINSLSDLINLYNVYISI